MKKTARFLSLLMAAVLTVVQTPASAAAEEEQPTHECTIVTVTAADSQTHTLICEECGAVATEAHSFGDWNVQDAQCHVCVCICGASVTAPHTWDQGVMDEESNSRIYTCTACSATRKEEAMPSLEKEETSTDEKKTRNLEATMTGDVDGDGQVTASDGMIVSAISQGTFSSATEIQPSAADVNHDGWVDGEDVNILYMILMGKN